jgi:hypothetical protein
MDLCSSKAQQPFLSQPQWTAIRDESSGASAYENLRALTRFHRVPATAEFDQAADYILQRAKEYGLSDAHKEEFPIDGKIHYGLMRSHFGWQVEGARLWQTAPERTLLADWATQPIRLADYSHSADVDGALIDVGAGTSEADYSGKDVRGKIVLADGVLSVVQRVAVMKHGAAGIVSDMPNQSTAWSGLDSTVVRWGHLDASLPNGFAFMISPGTAADLRRQISAGQTVMLSVHVQATVGPGHWTVVTGTIPGTDPQAGEAPGGKRQWKRMRVHLGRCAAAGATCRERPASSSPPDHSLPLGPGGRRHDGLSQPSSGYPKVAESRYPHGYGGRRSF